MDDQLGWAAARSLPVVPPSDLAEDQFIAVDGRRYWECGFSGWHLMLGWLCGPETLMRSPDIRHHYWDVTEHASGAVAVNRLAMPADDRREIEDGENGYLDFAGLPSDRPYGYRWFQILPKGLTAHDIHVAANNAIDAAGLIESPNISLAVPLAATTDGPVVPFDARLRSNRTDDGGTIAANASAPSRTGHSGLRQLVRATPIGQVMPLGPWLQ